MPARRFADLSVPLTVCVTDLDTGELLLFGEGGADAPLLEVLTATCALPVYFPPHFLDGRRCGDGGLRGPLPLEAAARLARETVVAVDVGPGFDLAPPVASARVARAIVRAHEEAVGHADGRRDRRAPRALAGDPLAGRSWSTCGRRSSATRPSAWSACASTPRTAIARRARR